MEKISQGAEAVIYREDEKIIKERIKKKYRADSIDKELRKKRTKKEAKVMKDVCENIPVPKILNVNEKEMKIEMGFIEGDKIRDILEKSDYKKLSKQIGKLVGILHSKNIIHGDLTTSNMILKENDEENKIYFIDFGLSVHSDKTEDKAVDLHLLKQALESRHYTIWDECFKAVIEGYKEENKEYDAVLKRFEKVELRGRNKLKGC
jgi:TP53 regulating kinase-like protein